MFIPFVLIYYVGIVLSTTSEDISRLKRVINGYVPVVNKERLFEYENIRYTVWIGAASFCSSSRTTGMDVPLWWTISSRPCFPAVEDELCGGALIHPRIVQTAGHCISTLVYNEEEPKQAWVPGRVFSIWESMMQIFVGYTDVEQFFEPSFSRFFLLHPLYARLRHSHFGWLSHDFGWIILNSEPFKADYWNNAVAPVLTIQALALNTRDLLKNQGVCLFSGFGAWQYQDKEIFNTSASRYLRYGWQVTTTYGQCWWYLHRLTGIDRATRKWPRWSYKKYATWFCQVPFGDYLLGNPAVGDSGSPVHCNGRMIALVSGGKWQNKNKKGTERIHVTRTMGLAYSLFENAVEYRQYFVATVKWYARVRQVARTLRPFINNRRQREVDLDTTAVEYSLKSEGVLRTSHAISGVPTILILTFYMFSTA